MAEARPTISVIGCGRLGLCTALCWEKAGYDVIGMDVVDSYVQALNDKTFNSSEPRVNEFLQAAKHFRATTDLAEAVAHASILFVLVDTPSTGGSAENAYDVSRLGNVLQGINALKPQGKHVVVGCTVMPGYCRDVGSFLLRDCPETTVSYNPEFIQQGDIIRGFLAPDMVLIGEGSKAAGDALEELYVKTTENTPVISRMSPSSAEITKISINCFITTKIAFANMVGDIADLTEGADKNQIMQAVGADSRIGMKCIRPGYGFGGPCFPRDNRALGGYAETVGIEPLIPYATDNSNKQHTEKMIRDKLNENLEVYTFSDVAYKPQCPVPIIEESQKLAVAVGVAKAGKRVILKDRDFIIDAVMKLHGRLFEYEVTNAVTDAHTAEAHAADDGAMSKKDKKKAAKDAKKKANAESGNAPAEQQPKQSKKDKKKGGAEVEKTPEELEKMAKKKRAAVFKEGGKKGVEIEGACDMGGMAFFCTQLDEPDGDMELLEYGFEGMNAECDPSEEERKGGAGGVGKVVFSAGTKELLMVCNVPENRLTETVSSMEGIKPMKGIKATDWLNFIVKSFAKTHEGTQIDASSTDTYAKAALCGLSDLAMFPVKMKDDAMAAAYSFLKQNDCMPPSDDEDEVIYHFEADDGY